MRFEKIWGENMANEDMQKQFIFDPIFAADIKDTCANNPPEGSAPEDFGVVVGPEFCALMFNADKEAQALEVLFIAVGRAWHEAKKKVI